MKTLMTIILLITAIAARPDKWKLAWSDEFDQSSLPDSSRWGYGTRFIRNNERQFYTRARKETGRVENGMIIIESRKERWNDPPAAEKAGGAARPRIIVDAFRDDFSHAFDGSVPKRRPAVS